MIKCDAAAGGAGVIGASTSGSFVDTARFLDSDLNYFIQVRVTNTKIVAQNLTRFYPVSSISNLEFTRVYGDSFVSGFVQGGEFSALISIKLRNREHARAVAEKLSAAMNLQTAFGQGKIDRTRLNLDHLYEGETSISVCWKGGGVVENPGDNGWTLQTLKDVALNFPERVTACPAYTKYMHLDTLPSIYL